jgi:subtilase family serine protease
LLLSRLYDRADPLYGKYLSPQEFADRFGPTQADYDTIAAYARSLGLSVTQAHPNRTLLDASGPAGALEAGFNLRMNRYKATDGREFYAPDDDPEVSEFAASRLVGVIGLENANIRHAHSRYSLAQTQGYAPPNQIGTGVGGGLSPADIARLYNLQSVSADGSGQTLGLFELAGYDAEDIAGYASYYGLTSAPLRNVLVDGFSGRAGSGDSEATLDIELQIALAPGASQIVVYMGPNTNSGVLRTYNRIATDNLARQVSTSWGLSEAQSGSAFLNAENAIFQQMAAQGQTIYAAAGDSGAYDNGFALSVDDPASQPYVIGVGGTRLYVRSDQTRDRETSWNSDNTIRGGAGGGGVSGVWSIPAWQRAYISEGSLGSTTMRNVPDVSLNADPKTGYSIYYRGRWYIFGGTSCASPLWAAYTARVNQQRAAHGIGPLGFANPEIYQAAAGSSGGTFYDVADGSTNLHYPAVAGYDNATGWGSFNGANLLAEMAPEGGSGSRPDMVVYYNALGQEYTGEDVAYWQTMADGKWWMGDKGGRITAVDWPPWLH